MRTKGTIVHVEFQGLTTQVLLKLAFHYFELRWGGSDCGNVAF